MDTKEHRARHVLLHQMLDELLADYITHSNRLLSETSVMELMQWSYSQTVNPTPNPNAT